MQARIKSFETAFGMQMEAPDAFDFSKESDATHDLHARHGVVLATGGFSRHPVLRQRLEGLVASHPDVFDHLRGSGLMLPTLPVAWPRPSRSPQMFEAGFVRVCARPVGEPPTNVR